MNNQQLMNLLSPKTIFWLIVIGFSVFGWVARQVSARKQAQAVKKEKERRELEALRTGQYTPEPRRTPAAAESRASTPPASARESLEEIAARRRAKISQMQRSAPGNRPSTSLPSGGQASGQKAADEIGRVLGQILGVPTPPGPAGRPAPSQPQGRGPVFGQSGNRPGNPTKGRPAGQWTGRPGQRPQPQRQAPARPPAPPARGQAPRAPVPDPRSSQQSNRPRPNQADAQAQHASAQKMAQGKQAPVHDANAPIYSYAIGDEGKNQANRAAAKRPNHRAEVGGTSLRRLFTLREIFEKPVAFREDHL